MVPGSIRVDHLRGTELFEGAIESLFLRGGHLLRGHRGQYPRRLQPHLPDRIVQQGINHGEPRFRLDELQDPDRRGSKDRTRIAERALNSRDRLLAQVALQQGYGGRASDRRMAASSASCTKADSAPASPFLPA